MLCWILDNTDKTESEVASGSAMTVGYQGAAITLHSIYLVSGHLEISIMSYSTSLHSSNKLEKK